MKNWQIATVLLLCLVLAGSMACTPFDGGGEEETSQQLVEVVRGDLTVSVTADGSLSFVIDRKLTFGVSGTVTEINVEEGDWVTEGQMLVSLDATSLELAVKTAEIDLEMATNSYRKITYPYTYHTFAFSVPESIVAVGDAQRQLNEALEALEIGLSSDQYWEVWRQLKQAQDSLTQAREKLARGQGADVFEAGIIPIKDYWTLRAAQLEMEKAQLALDKAENDLEKAMIVAPFDGIAAAVNVKEGDKLSSVDYATKTIVELIAPISMELTAEVDEIDVPAVKLAQNAVISVDALPALQLEGEVTSISLLPMVEAGIVSYEVTIGLSVSEDSELKVGMSVTADIIIDERSNVLLVPYRAVKQDSQGNPIVEVMVNEQIEERAVVIGISDGYQTEIVSGLDEGELVVRKAS